MKNFQDQVVFLTGASSGIGAALAREFAEQGAKLILTARRKENLKKLEQELNQNIAQSIAITCDVTQEKELNEAVHQTKEKFGKINIVIANAGFGVAGNLENLTLEDYQRQFDTNVFGVLKTIYATLEELRKTKGTLVIIGSVAGYFTHAGSSAYSMSKYAVRALAETLQFELSDDGISVVLISPGLVESEFQQIDNRGIFHPEVSSNRNLPTWLFMPAKKAAKQIVKAIRKKKKEQLITGHGKAMVFLKRHFPRLCHWLLKIGGAKSRRKAIENSVDLSSKKMS